MFLISRRGSGCAGLFRGARGAGSLSRERCSHLEYATFSLQSHSGSTALSADTCISYIFYASFHTNCFCRLCAFSACLAFCIFCFETTSFKLLRRPITTRTLFKSPTFGNPHFLIDTFQRHSCHYPYQPSSYTCLHSDSVLVRRDKKKTSIYPGTLLCRHKKASAAAVLRLFPA